MKVFLIVLIAFFTVILINILVYKLIVYMALKKYIKPYFMANKLILNDYKFTGFFNHGAFENKKPEIVSIPQSGNILNDTYINLIVTDNNSSPIKYTAKISTVFLVITKVEIKHDNSKSIKLK